MSFNPDRDIPSQAGKVILITGGTAGLGAGSIAELAKHEPAQIIFTGRSAAKAEQIKARVASVHPRVNVTFINCDISSFDSVREGAEAVKKATDRLDVLMLNAGIMAQPPALSKDGYEIQFATNYLGHALLLQLLLPLLQETAKLAGADVRVISLTSIAHKRAPTGGIIFDQLKTEQESLGGLGSSMAKWRRYGQSKLAQLLYNGELAKHYPEITFVAIHPGVIMTDLFGNLDFMTKLPTLLVSMGRKTPVSEGHYHQCWAATVDKSELKSGEYYEPTGVVGHRSIDAENDSLAEQLWKWTQREISVS